MPQAKRAVPQPALKEKPTDKKDQLEEVFDDFLSENNASENENQMTEIFDDFLSKNSASEEDKIIELAMKLYEILDLMQRDNISNIKGLKEFYDNYKTLCELVKRTASDEAKKELDEIQKAMQDKVKHHIDIGEVTNDEVNEFIRLLYLTEKTYKKDKLAQAKIDSNSLEELEEYDVSEIDELYKKLYEAINDNDKKKITLYRGRIIRKLKKKKKLIEKEYEAVQVLDEIKTLLDLNTGTMDEINKVLAKEENKELQEQMKDVVSDYNAFKEKFNTIYVQEDVRKKKLYKDALKIELKEHRKVLDERYSKEFLDKKANIFSVAKMLPNAVALSVKRWVNTINELKEAKTNRRKMAEVKEVMKATGKMVGTPVLYLGKFAASNWYSIYLLHKGLTTIKQQKELVEDNNTPTAATKPETQKNEEQTPPATQAPQTKAPATISEKEQERLRQQEERLMPEKKETPSESNVENPNAGENPDQSALEDPNASPAHCYDPRYKPNHQHAPQPATEEEPKVETETDTSDIEIVVEPDNFWVLCCNQGGVFPFLVMPRPVAQALGYNYSGNTNIGNVYMDFDDLAPKK